MTRETIKAAIETLDDLKRLLEKGLVNQETSEKVANTDEQIIKALEIHADNEAGCSECPIYHSDTGDTCAYELAQNALDLINRQKAEIEKKSNKLRDVLPIVAELKAEAITEFAERLCEGRVSNDPVVIAVKTELKMMKGEQ